MNLQDKTKKLRLTSPSDIRRALCWACNAMIAGRLDAVQCGKISYACSIALKCYEVQSLSNLDERLTVLEDS